MGSVPMRSALCLTVVLAAWALGPAPAAPREPASAVGAAAGDLVLVPLVVDRVRAAVPVRAGLLACNATARERVELVGARVRLASDVPGGAGPVLAELPLAEVLPPDADYLRANALVERLPLELTERHRPRAFAAEDAPTFAGDAVLARFEETRELVARLRERHAADPASRSFAQPVLELDLARAFPPGTPAGTEARLAFEVDYRVAGGALATARELATIEWAGPRAGLPAHLVGSGMSVHAGDLHVHSCHGEALGACAPSTDCAAESVQTSGSFTYAELETQLRALGLDWFSATDHSYCVNDDAEYAAIAAELAAIEDPDFLALPDLEVSSDEEGPQIGSDLGNLLCLFGAQQNHVGAHGISERIPGGSSGFLGFCGGLEPFSDNVAEIRSQGGFAVANHPTAGSFAWNGFDAAVGLEADGLHGVEVWNGALQTGQGGDVGRWVDWLRAGRVLYAYSGSDTHDAAFDFGANHVVLDAGEPFDRPTLRAALAAGRVYLSNGPALLVEVDAMGETLFMGTRASVPVQDLPEPVTVRAHYDFGADTGSVTVYAGAVGDPAELVLGSASGLTGSGTVAFADVLSGGARRWYRAYAENAAGDEAAYANPVFVEPRDALVASPTSASLSGGGAFGFDLAAGPGRAGEVYWILGSLTGTSPGFDLGGVSVPLVPDAYFQLTLQPFSGLFTAFLGILSELGTAQAAIGVPAGSDPSLAGIVLFHAFVSVEPPGTVTLASHPVAVQFVP